MDLEVEAARRVGTTLCNKWTLERLIGTGGMAAVYVGVHKIGRREAIKILHPDIARDPDLRARFEQEAHAVNRFKHPGAVEIRDIDVAEDGAPFLVMELLEGHPLSDLARQPAGVALPDLLRLMDELLDVLSAAHARGIIHRDIKPDNLFVLNDGHLKVLDFGIARVRANTLRQKPRTRMGATLGTAPYMPPEQIKGQEIDARADLFAVGATMFRLIARRRVHEASNETETLVKMASEPAPPLSSVAPDAPRDVCVVVDRALMFDRANRYPDAATMQEDVRALREGRAPPYAHARLLEGTPAPSALRVPQVLLAQSAALGSPLAGHAAGAPASVSAVGGPAMGGPAMGGPTGSAVIVPPSALGGSAVIVPPATGTSMTRAPMTGEEPTSYAPEPSAQLAALARPVTMGGAPHTGWGPPGSIAAALPPPPPLENTAAASPVGGPLPPMDITAAASPVGIASLASSAQSPSSSSVPTLQPATRPMTGASGANGAGPPSSGSLEQSLPQVATTTPVSGGIVRPPGADRTLKSAATDNAGGAPPRPHGYAVPAMTALPVAGAGPGPRTQPTGAEPLPPGATIPVVSPARSKDEPNIVLLVLVGVAFAAIGVTLTLWIMLRGPRDRTPATGPAAATASADPEPDIWPPNPKRPAPRPAPAPQPAPQPRPPAPQPTHQPPSLPFPFPRMDGPGQPGNPPGGPGKGHGKGHGKKDRDRD